MKLFGTDATEGVSDIEEQRQSSGNLVQEEASFSTSSYEPNQENLSEREKETAATMNGISSFLETMHSKNLTLKKLAKVQQRRIDELTQENIALRRASELKDDELRRTQAALNTLRDTVGDTDLSEYGSDLHGNSSPSKVYISPQYEPSSASDSAARSKSPRSAKQTASTRLKSSVIVSPHKAAAKRVMHFMRKINNACNGRNIGLYTFVCCVAQTTLPQLLGSSSETYDIVYIPRT